MTKLANKVLCTGLIAVMLTFTTACTSWPIVIATAEAIAQLVVATDPDAAGAIKISSLAVTGLQNIEALYNSYKADKNGSGTLAALQAAVLAFDQNLSQTLATAQISNAATKARITAAVNIILDYVDALAGVSPQAQTLMANARVARGASAAPKVMSKSDVIKRWKNEVCQTDTKCSNLVH
jgi:hypothetical protein